MQLPPLLYARVHSQQDPTDPGSSSAASILVHSTANGPLAFDATAQSRLLLHQHPTVDQLQHSTPAAGMCPDTRHSPSSTFRTGAILGCCDAAQSMNPFQSHVKRQDHAQQDKPCSSAASFSASSQGLPPCALSTWPKKQHQQQHGAATRDVNEWQPVMSFDQHHLDQQRHSLATTDKTSLASSSAWLESVQRISSLQLSALNSADLAYLTFAAASNSQVSAPLSCDSQRLQTTADHHDEVHHHDAHVLAGQDVCSRGQSQEADVNACDMCHATKVSHTPVSDISAAAQPHRKVLQKELSQTPRKHLQSLVKECSDALCNMHATEDDTRTSVDSSYCDDDWELQSDKD